MKRLLLILAIPFIFSCTKDSGKVSNCDDVYFVKWVYYKNFQGLSGYIFRRQDTLWHDPNLCGIKLDSCIAKAKAGLPKPDLIADTMFEYHFKFKINYIP